MSKRPSRRAVVGSAAAAFAGPAFAASEWSAGRLTHVIPTVSHDEFLLKCSFDRPLQAPRLQVGGRSVAGVPGDSSGRYWSFRAEGLSPGRAYRLELREGRAALCDPWPLSTFPRPDAAPSRVRLVTFMCAGGWEGSRGPRGIESFRTLAVRRRLLARALSFQPDALIANGDHVYWDQKSWLEHPNEEIRRRSSENYDRFGRFDWTRPMSAAPNDALLRRVGEQQIGQLYGSMLRSTPSFFLPDDHDYLENDEAQEKFVTFPPDLGQAEAQRIIQRLFYPEFLPDAGRPLALPGTIQAPGPESGLSRGFGSLRYGRLLEVLLYDTVGFLSLKDGAAGLVPPEAEAWILDRIGRSDAAQMIHCPSFPLGWTAGKWREWYPDVVVTDTDSGAGQKVVATHSFEGRTSRLTEERPKYLWQRGWWSQHQRLVQAMTSRADRPAIVASGDIHAVGRTTVVRSGDLDLSRNPLHAFLVGPLGSSMSGWPSFARGVAPATPARLSAQDFRAPQEKNGFTLIDVEPQAVTVRQFAWREPQTVEAIDSLEPFETTLVPRARP